MSLCQWVDRTLARFKSYINDPDLNIQILAVGVVGGEKSVRGLSFEDVINLCRHILTVVQMRLWVERHMATIIFGKSKNER